MREGERPDNRRDEGGIGDGEAWREAFEQIGALGFGGIVALLGLGLWEAWAWLALNKGVPLYRGGTSELLPPVLALLAFALAMLACAKAPLLRRGSSGRWLPWLAGGVAAAGCAVLGLEAAGLVPDGSELVAAVACGAGAALLLFLFGLAFSRLEPGPALVAYVGSALTCFVAYFCLDGLGSVGGDMLFAALPLLCALCLWVDRPETAWRGAAREGREVSAGSGVEEPAARAEKAPADSLVTRAGTSRPGFGGRVEGASGLAGRPQRYSTGYRRLCLAAAVFFGAVSFTHAMAPIEEHGFASDAGVVCMMLAEAVVLGVYVTRRGTFRILKTCYLASVLLIIFANTVAPITSDTNLAFEALRNASYFLLLMVVWLLLAWVAGYGETPAREVFGIAFAGIGVGMAVGWAAGVVLHQEYGDARDAFTMAVGFVVLAFFSFGFNVRDFPKLVRESRGRAAREREVDDPVPDTLDDLRERRLCEVAGAHDLSPRELDVLRLLASGHGGERIAEELGISYHTVRAHVRSIYKKLDVHSREELLDEIELPR